MEVKFDKTDSTIGKVTVDIVPDDYTSKVKTELKRIGSTHTIPGFRKGHVDTNYLMKRFGKEVKADVINRLVADAALDYLHDNKIAILAQPLPVDTPTEITLDNNAYTFTYEVALAPEIDVQLTKDVTLPYYKVEITDKMIDEHDTMLRERFGKQEPGDEADEKALIKGRLTQLDADGKPDESPEAIKVENGIVAPMFFKDKDQAALFLHCHVGDKIVFNPWKTCEGNAAELSSMLQITDKDRAAEVKSNFEITVAEIIVLKPAQPGEEFYKQVFGPEAKIDNEEMYRKAVGSLIEAQYVNNQEVVFQNLAHKYLVDTYGSKIEIPFEFLKKWIALNNSDVTDEKLEADKEAIVADAKWQLIRQAVEEKLDIKLNEQDILGYATQLARHQLAQYGMTNYPEEVYKDYANRLLADKENRSRIASQVSVLALFGAIRNAVSLDVKTVSLDEFQQIGKKSEED